MKDIDLIRAEISHLQDDERVKDKPANVFSNAPLALIQTSLEARILALQWVLDNDNIS